MIVLGRIGSPFGINGWVKIQVFGDDPLSWQQMPKWWLSKSDQAASTDWQLFSLEKCRIQGKSFIAKFVDINNRNAAETLQSFYLGAPRSDLPKTTANEYYWGDLIGCVVVNEEEQTLGTVHSLISTGAHEVLVVRDGEQERLIPFVPQYALNVDIAQHKIDVSWQTDW